MQRMQKKLVNRPKTVPSSNPKPDLHANILIPPKFLFQISDEIIFYTENEYLDLLESSLQNLQFLFKISKHCSLEILQKNKYDLCDAIKELFFLRKDMNSLCLSNIFRKNLRKYSENPLFEFFSSENRQKNDENNKICPICEETKPQKDFFSLECLHEFCEDCFKNYLKASMDNDGPLCFRKTCPMEGCKILVEIDNFEKIYKNDYVLLAKSKQLLRLFLLNSQPNNIKHCPKPNCQYIYRLSEDFSDQNIKISCPNQHSFCHKCQMEPHYPFTCSEYQFWFIADDFIWKQDVFWISKHCKKCPKCGWNIQKNEGCNHMTCRTCRHEFCWLCFQDYGTHNNQICAKRAHEKNELKKKFLASAANFLRKGILIESWKKFMTIHQKKNNDFLRNLKKQKYVAKKENMENEEFIDNKTKLFQYFNEIDEFSFISSKISFVFLPSQNNMDLIKKSKDDLNNCIMRFKNSNQSSKLSNKRALDKKLQEYVVLIEKIMDESRKSESLFSEYLS